MRVAAISLAVYLPLSLALVPRWGPSGAALALLCSTALSCCLYCAAVFRPDVRGIVFTFGRVGIAAASLALFLAVGRQNHPAILAVGACGVYLGVLLLVQGASARHVMALFRGWQ
jgi:O-antigen/teichoic acid export membrane protein